jgi:outer membrane protein
LLLLAFSLSSNAYAQSAALKIGFVNAAKVLESAPQAQAATKRLEKEFAPRQEALVADKRVLKDQEEKLARDATVMTETNRRDLERQIVNLRRDIKRAEEEFREDLNIRRNDELAKLQRQIVATVQEFAKQEGFDLVLTDGVLYAGARTDITGLVLQRLEGDFAASQAEQGKR